MHTVIELRHLTKSYPTPQGRRYVFRDLSFSFPEGRSIGLIGANGAGKSTLMRLLGGIDAPDSGCVVTDRSISWPVGLTGGFQGSLTARDNVKFVCRLYGASGDAMRERLAFIEEFAEIGSYFDAPVKSFSSGMRARVAFGLSMAFHFDYYLIDEALAVGDAQFKKKCQAVFEQRLQTSKLILVSHNMNDILRLCDAVVLVQHGAATLFEDVAAGIDAYKGLASTHAVAPGTVRVAPVAQSAHTAHTAHVPSSPTALAA
ncbi:MAG: ABC-type polysaccharide/polyol phosphate transport system ATPase component-like protein [Rhizobacter sp.]|nr:ABC-type polysaccharide/polyol phosphate transport system ATPase component-like protein [Rhizobacter sp.]